MAAARRWINRCNPSGSSSLLTTTYSANNNVVITSLASLSSHHFSTMSEASVPYIELGIDASDPRVQRQLQNFAIFNKKGGKFRVAVLNACNMNCFFCHNEGMDNPRTPNPPPRRNTAEASSSSSSPSPSPQHQQKTGLKRGPEVLSAADLLDLMNGT